jgi:hypothetical protein
MSVRKKLQVPSKGSWRNTTIHERISCEISTNIVVVIAAAVVAIVAVIAELYNHVLLAVRKMPKCTGWSPKKKNLNYLGGLSTQ